MKKIKVLGTGCSKCTKTAEMIQMFADELRVEVLILKETDPEMIMNYDVMSTPAVVIDERVVHSGSVPKKVLIEAWLKA